MCGDKQLKDVPIDEFKLGTYLNASQCIPYITAEFNKGQVTNQFTVGDGRYYKRGSTTARKRRAVVPGEIVCYL